MRISINDITINLNDSLRLPETNDYRAINNYELFDYLEQMDNFESGSTKELKIDNITYYILKVRDTYYDNNYYYILSGVGSINDLISSVYSSEFFETADDHYIVNKNNNEDFYYCDSCYEWVHQDYIIHTEDDYYYCDDCWNEHNSTNINYDTTSNEVIGTIETTNEYSNAISGYHNYFRSFIPRLLENETTNELYGVELEVENVNNYYYNNKIASYILNNLNCVIATDGSLSNGFEIISDPQSFNYWLSRKDKIEKVFNELVKGGIRSDETSTCGLHIHVSRLALGQTIDEQKEVIARLELIIENFKDELKNFSRRNGSFGYCRFLSDLTTFELSTDDIKLKKEDTSDRYQVINTNNVKTIEFRVFKGTLNATTFYACLQLVHNLIEVAKSGNYKGKTWQHIITINNYKELINYNNIRNIKTLKRIKDYTEKIKLQKEKQDKKMLELKEEQKKRLSDIKNYIVKNITLINAILKYQDSSTLDNIFYYSNCILDAKDDIIHKFESFKNILSKYKSFLASSASYRTLDNQIIYYYDYETLKEYSITIPALLETIKNEVA